MKRIIQLFISVAMPLYGVAQESFDYYAAPFSYLFEVTEGYAEANFAYPTSVDDILKYWQADKRSAITREILTDKVIERLDTLTFSRLDRERRDISIGLENEYFIIRYKQDTLFCRSIPDYRDPLAGYSDLDRATMRNFYHVSMQCSDSQVHNDATEELQSAFNKGLYRMVASKLPEFRENRKQRKPFKAIILEFQHGTLNPKYCADSFDPDMLPLYADVRRYVADFAAKHRFTRIIFYYMYD